MKYRAFTLALITLLTLTLDPLVSGSGWVRVGEGILRFWYTSCGRRDSDSFGFSLSRPAWELRIVFSFEEILISKGYGEPPITHSFSANLTSWKGDVLAHRDIVIGLNESAEWRIEGIFLKGYYGLDIRVRDLGYGACIYLYVTVYYRPFRAVSGIYRWRLYFPK